ncbi:MAG: transcription antitermination factor NusB [Proteobacteria bacterium]|nr:transcription antitermination factor NusB [Pseudomonadota bacterium]
MRARRCVVQALYQWIVARTPPADIIREFVADRELIKVDIEYFTELTRSIPLKFDELLGEINPVIDRQWAQVDPVEQAILLIGTYELRFCPHVPWRVVVNEAVELCKMFGAEDAHKYINGVLDKLARTARVAEISATSSA